MATALAILSRPCGAGVCNPEDRAVKIGPSQRSTPPTKVFQTEKSFSNRTMSA